MFCKGVEIGNLESGRAGDWVRGATDSTGPRLYRIARKMAGFPAKLPASYLTTLPAHLTSRPRRDTQSAKYFVEGYVLPFAPSVRGGYSRRYQPHILKGATTPTLGPGQLSSTSKVSHLSHINPFNCIFFPSLKWRPPKVSSTQHSYRPQSPPLSMHHSPSGPYKEATMQRVF